MEWNYSQLEEGNLTGRSRIRRLFSRLPFSIKVLIHIVIVILLTGTTITSVVAYQYQQEVDRREHEQARTVFTTGVNYLIEHYNSHGQKFASRNLDFVFGSRFLQLEGDDSPKLSMHPNRIFLYDPSGSLIYQFADEREKPLPASLAPPPEKEFREWYELEKSVIHVAGPIRNRDEIIGYTHFTLSTQIEFHRQLLFQRTLGVASMIVLFSVLLSMVFARTYLAPILSLTRAGRKVRQVDLHQSVPVRTEDEIGILTATFNDMVANLGTRIQLMHRLQAETVRISRELDRDKLLDTLADIFTRLSGSAGYRLYLYNKESQQLDPHTETGSDLLPQPQMDRLSQMAFEERWTQYLKETGVMDSEPGRVLEAAIPLLSGKHRVGVIRIGPRNDEEFYDDENLTILQTLAQHASVSIDNTDLLDRIATQQRIAQEMQLARQIQQAMLPESAPDVPGYSICGVSIAALEVGGDYFDYVESIDGHIHFVLGDVSGKGVPAAFIMSIVRSLVHSFSEMDSSPLELVRKLNRRITEDTEPEMFVTLAAIDLNPATHETRIIRAGHEPILLLKKDGTVTRISPPGTAVGLLDPDTFEAVTQMETYALGEEDTLILFTDGVSESQNRAGEEYGIERLEAVLASRASLSLQDLFHQVQQEVTHFSDGVEQLDDITLLMLRRNPRG
jgi:sigma-B regulation protein RsbU (phosphoserine phosphatase)